VASVYTVAAKKIFDWKRGACRKNI